MQPEITLPFSVNSLTKECGCRPKMFGFKRSVALLVVCLAWALQYYTFGSVLLWYIFAVSLALAVVYAVGTYDHEYWTDRGIYAPPSAPFVGHIKTVVTFKEQGGLFFKRIYDQYKDLRFLGEYSSKHFICFYKLRRQETLTKTARYSEY